LNSIVIPLTVLSKIFTEPVSMLNSERIGLNFIW